MPILKRGIKVIHICKCGRKTNNPAGVCFVCGYKKIKLDKRKKI